MWRRVSFRFFSRTWPTVSQPKNFHVKFAGRIGATLVTPVVFLESPHTQTTPPVNLAQLQSKAPVTNAVSTEETSPPWQPTLGDVMHVAKLLLIGGLVWGFSGVAIGSLIFRVCTNVGHPVSLLISVPSCILSGAILCVVGLYRGFGHSIMYFIDKGVVIRILQKVVPAGATDATVIHWDAAVSRVTYSFRVRAEHSSFLTRIILRVLAQRLEKFLLLVKDEDKTRYATLTEAAINHKLKKVVKRQMRKPLYVVGALYGLVAGLVGYLAWKS